jgi:hypothetical protein
MLESGARRPNRGQILGLAAALRLDVGSTDGLLMAGGQFPRAYDRISPADPDVLLVVRALGDQSTPEAHRLWLRGVLRALLARGHAPPVETPDA